LEHRESKENRAGLELSGFKELRAGMEHRESKDHREGLELRGFKETEESASRENGGSQGKQQ